MRSPLPLRDVLLLLMLCLGLRSVSFVRTCLSDDEATYCVVGREMLAGRVLYRDVVDHKPPLVYVTYAATQAIGGPAGGMRIVHLLVTLVVFATAILLAFIVRRFGPASPPGAPLFAALLYVVFTTTFFAFDSLAANCELFMMLPLTGSVALHLGGVARDRFRPSLLAGAGALVGVAMFYKYQGGIHLALYGLHAAWLHRRRPRRVAAAWCAMGAGMVAVVGIGVAVLHLFDSLRAGWFWFRFNFAYIREGMSRSEVVARAAPRVGFVVASALFLWVLGIRAAIQALRRRAGQPKDAGTGFDRFAVGWLLVSVMAVTAGGRFFGHYFHQVTAPLAVLAARASAELWVSRRKLVLAALGLPAAAFFLVGVGQARILAAFGQPDPDYATMAAFIGAHSRREDALFIWGNSPVLYFEAGRPLGARFAFANYLTGLSPATSSQSDPKVEAKANIVPESWDMLEADLAQRRPRLFVDASPGDVGHYGKFPPEHFPRLQRILARDYRPIGDVAGVRMFARREEPEHEHEHEREEDR